MKLFKEHQLPVLVFPPLSRNEKMAAMCSSGIFVFAPGEPEGHPWVIVEALACGLPVISTDQGAKMESVREGKNGFIANKNAPAEIAEKIKLLMKNDALRKQMGVASRKHCEENFTEEEMVERFAGTFYNMIE